MIDSALTGLPVGSAAGSRVDLLGIKTNTELLAMEKLKALQIQQTPFISSLGNYLKTQWEYARRAKDPIQVELLQNLRQRSGQYDPDKLAEIRKQGASEIFMMITASICRAGESWIKEIMLSPDERPWSIEPTSVPRLTPEEDSFLKQRVMQQFQNAVQQQFAADGVITPQEMQVAPEMVRQQAAEIAEQLQIELHHMAKDQAELMTEHIEDQLVEGGFYEALNEVLSDVLTYKAGILKGPMVRKRHTLNWVQDPQLGWTASESEDFHLVFERRSPMDIYPGPDATNSQDSYLIDRLKLSVEALNAMIGVKGYDDAAIRAVIDEHGIGGLREWLWSDQQRAVAEYRPMEMMSPTQLVDALEYWGPIPGKMLLEWGVDAALVPDPTKAYQAHAILIGRWVIRAALNPDPMHRRPYGVACFEKVPGSFWGHGVPELIKDIQQVCNATARALTGNLAVSSGPQVVINDINRIPKSESITNMYPWKVWQFKPDTMSNGQKPIDFFQPGSNSRELLEVYDFFYQQARSVTGIPSNEQGDFTGANRTASGMSMVLSQASRGLKMVAANVDSGIIEPIIRAVYTHNMLYSDNAQIKGDLCVRAKGSSSLVAKEQSQVRRNEFLQVVLSSPVAQQVIGLKGVAALLREGVKGLDLENINDVVPHYDLLPDLPPGMPIPTEAPQPQAAGPEQGPEQGRETQPNGAVTGDASTFQNQPRA